MKISANGISIEVEDHGSPNAEPLLLIMGLGMQLVAWDEDFVESLVRRGFRVIRFDNRDIGLSQDFDQCGVPNLALDALRFGVGLRVASPYSLVEMAADSVGVLDALGIGKAHICGASMGGMIAQRIAVHFPERVQSLTLMMSSSGARRLPGPSWKIRSALLARPRDPTDMGRILAHYTRLYRLIGSPGFRDAHPYVQRRLELALQRSYRPAGSARQMVAIAADGDRSPLLARIALPTQVIHGSDDPLVPLPAGRDLARKIAGARIDVIDGMGHDLPTALWPRLIAGIEAAAGRA